MKYTICVLLCTSSFVWGMENSDNENLAKTVTGTRAVLQELSLNHQNNVLPINNKNVITYPTCLNLTRWGPSRAETLDIVKRQLDHFMDVHHSNIMDLKALHFFDKGFLDGNEKVMRILYRVFTNEQGGGNWPSVALDFANHPEDFFKDADALSALIKSNEFQSDVALKNLLGQMKQSFFIARWMATYYWNNKS